MKLEYEITGYGWATVRLEHEAVALSMTTSYIDADLEQLLDVSVELCGSVTDAKLYWAEEPGRYIWTLAERQRSVRLGITATWVRSEKDVVRFVDASGLMVERRIRELAEERGHDDEYDFPLFDIQVPLADFAKAVLAAADNVLATVGKRGFRKQWSSPFPTQKLAALRNIVSSGELISEDA